MADCLSARREEVKMWGIINRIWQGVSSKPMLQMFDKMSVRVTGVVCLFSLALLFLLFEVVGSWSLILAWMWALPSCLLHKERGKEQIQSCKASLNTNTQSLCPSKPLCSFCASSSNIVHCYGLSVLLQVSLICLLSLLCSFFKGNKSNWWREATEKSLTRNTSTTLPTPPNKLSIPLLWISACVVF